MSSTSSMDLEERLKEVNSAATWPTRLSLLRDSDVPRSAVFSDTWRQLMSECCHNHDVWQDPFALALDDPSLPHKTHFNLASIWAINMVVGSYCFPRYVAALAARAALDGVRHGLLENAWDESGGHGHTSRSHFWLAVKLARLLGLSDFQIEHSRPIPAAQTYTQEHYVECAQGSFEFALGMLCLIEEFTTPEFTLIFRALKRSSESVIGIDPTDFMLKGGAEYFVANIVDDERHREAMPRLVAIWLHANGVDLNSLSQIQEGLEPIRAGARHSANLRRDFFQGIYDFVQEGGTVSDLISTKTRF